MPGSSQALYDGGNQAPSIWNWLLKVNSYLIAIKARPTNPLDSSVSCEGLDKIVIEEDEERYFQIRIELSSDEKEELVNFLRRNLDFFA